MTGEETYEGSQVLEAVRLGQSRLIPQHERDLNDASQTRRHQGVPKESVDHSTDHQLLGVSGHGIASHHDDNCRNEVTLRTATAGTTEPHAEETSTPPDNPHRGVLEVIVNPRGTPPVLGKSVNTAPSGDDERIEELLTAAGTAQPVLADKQKNSQADTICDECRAHDEMGHTLTEVITAAEAERGNATKDHLRPDEDGHDLANDTVGQHEDPSDAGLARFLQVQLEIHSEGDLRDQQEHQPVCDGGVQVLLELATFVSVAEEVG